MNKFEIKYCSELQLLRIVFLDYLGNDDLSEFGKAIEAVLDGKKVPYVIGDFYPLKGKKIEVLAKPAREFVAQLGERYGVKKIAVFGVPLIFRTVIRGIMFLLKSKLQLEYEFFSTNEEAMKWLIPERNDV